ncbi:hypothetical protein V1503_23995 [Bacillus sp. SCS-151]|uniref:hypothetical protein n=1 Tax=Nanhaiella sioensis TaxID=3115293 RepID=UPI00397B7294
MKRIIKLLILLLAVIITFNPANSYANQTALEKNNKDSDDDIFVEQIILTKDDIKKYRKDNKIKFNPQDLQNNEEYLTNKTIEIELDHDKIEEAKTVALSNGYDWELGSISIERKFVDKNGEKLKIKDFKKLKKEKIYIVDPSKDDKNMDTSSLIYAAGTEIGDYRTEYYTYVTSSIISYNITDPNKTTRNRRHYIFAQHNFGDEHHQGGAVDTNDSDGDPDVAILAWSIGPQNNDSERFIDATYENVDGSFTETKDESDLDKNADGTDTNSIAYNIDEVYMYAPARYAYIKLVNMAVYTGWYDKGQFGEDGKTETVYAHGFKSDSLSVSVSVSPPKGVAIGVTPTSSSRVEKAKAYCLLETE